MYIYTGCSHVYINTCTNTHTQTHIHKHTYTNTHTQAHIHKHTYTNTHTKHPAKWGSSEDVYIHTHTHTYSYTHTHTDTNTHTYKKLQYMPNTLTTHAHLTFKTK